MKAFRLASTQFIDDYSGTGARLFGGRWNSKGMACIYTSQQISLALLEKFVHAQAKEDMRNVSLLQVLLPDDSSKIYDLDIEQMKKGWQHDTSYTQWLGDQILSDPEIVAFSAPSAIIPSERNIIINPQSAFIQEVSFLPSQPFETDGRLLLKLL